MKFLKETIRQLTEKKWLKYVVLIGVSFKLLKPFFDTKKLKKIGENFKKFFKKEEGEVEELARGEESLGKFCEDSGSLFKNYFIPSECNEFKPKILRTKSLLSIIFTLFAIKVFLLAYLFLVYPNIARMSELISGRVFELTNIAREEAGLADLNLDNSLNKVALAKAEDMVKRNYFAHANPDGKMIWETINRDEYAYIYVGENLGMNFTTAQSVHTALMNSPTHKKNILNDKFSDMGIAIVSGKIDGKSTNVLVEVFAKQKTGKTAVAPKEIVSAIKEVPVVGGAKVLAAENYVAEAPAQEKNIEFESKQDYKKDLFTARIVDFSRLVFSGILFLLIISLVVNIFVHITIQHKGVIAQAVFAILFVYSLLSVKIHFIESIVQKIIVL